MFCKTIILSNSENIASNAPKGILTLSKENLYIKGKIRLYNLSTLPINTKIGLYVNEKVYISSITKKPQHYEFDLNENIDITQSIYCALIDNSKNRKEVLLEGGNFNGFYFTDSPFDAVLEAKDEDLELSIDRAITNLDSCESCSCENCEYKKYFYDNYSENQNNNIYESSLNNYQYITLDNNINSLDDIDYYKGDNCDDISNVNIIKTIDLNKIVDNTSSINANTNSSNDINIIDTDEKNFDNLYNSQPYIVIDNFQSKVIEDLQNKLIDDAQNIGENDDINQNSMDELTSKAKQLLVDNQNLNDVNDYINNTDNVKAQREDTDTIPVDENYNTQSSREQMEFLNDIIYQLDEMFVKYPEDEMLNNIIPNSRFIQVNNEKPYVLGVIYEDNQLKYIAYGVPAKYNSLPPIDFGQHYQWLPLNPRDVMSDGYFMIYQDALNGTLVEINFEE